MDELFFETARLNIRAELPRDLARGIDVDGRIDGHHQPPVEQRLEDVLDARVQLVRQILHRHAFGERNGARHRRQFDRRLRRRRTSGRISPMAWPWATGPLLILAGALLILPRALRHSGPLRITAGTGRLSGGRTHGLRWQRARPAHHGRRRARRRARRRVRTRTARSTRTRRCRRGGGTDRRRRDHPRRWRCDRTTRLKRRRFRRRLPRFFHTQTDAGWHEPSRRARSGCRFFLSGRSGRGRLNLGDRWFGLLTQLLDYWWCGRFGHHHWLRRNFDYGRRRGRDRDRCRYLWRFVRRFQLGGGDFRSVQRPVE